MKLPTSQCGAEHPAPTLSTKRRAYIAPRLHTHPYTLVTGLSLPIGTPTLLPPQDQ